jgi:AmmeMemoRadiSam system protein B
MIRSIRQPVDTVGFAVSAAQMDAIAERIDATDGVRRSASTWRVAICPHDDYAYVGGLYPAVLDGVRARTVVIVGVAHKARTLGLENDLLFESFAAWSEPYGPVPVSPLRERIRRMLPDGVSRVHDEMHELEHSIEAIVPFLQRGRSDLEIIPVLVPAMSFERMRVVARALATALAGVMKDDDLTWGDDLAVVISNDAVHYGDEGWGGRDFARFGVDDRGYDEAIAYERRIIDECLLGEPTTESIRAFTEHTVDRDDHREYRWTWCGRYSVPFGLLMASVLAGALGAPPLDGELIGYGTSIDGRAHVPVEDLGMGVTAPAHLRHWVGYASIGYR